MYVYIYIIYIYICAYISNCLLLSLISSHYLRLTIYLLSPSVLAFHYSPAWAIVPHIMPVASSDF